MIPSNVTRNEKLASPLLVAYFLVPREPPKGLIGDDTFFPEHLGQMQDVHLLRDSQESPDSFGALGDSLLHDPFPRMSIGHGRWIKMVMVRVIAASIYHRLNDFPIEYQSGTARRNSTSVIVGLLQQFVF